MNKAIKGKRPKKQKLEDHLCFAIYSTNLAISKAYKSILEELGLTYTQYITIMALGEDDNQTVSGLGEQLFLESNTLTPILKKLQTLGYVCRQRGTEDERQVLVRVTDEGRRLREKALGMGLPNACGLTNSEFAATREFLVRLRDNLIQASEGEDGAEA